MKTIFKASASTAILVAFLATSAHAADVYHQGGMKDEATPADYNRGSSNHSGFYIKGDLGIANGDRDIHRSVNRNLGLFATEEGLFKAVAGDDNLIDCEEAKQAGFSESDIEALKKAHTDNNPNSKAERAPKFSPEDFQAADLALRDKAGELLTSVNVPNTVDDTGIAVPLISDVLSFNSSDDINATVFGGEVSYLFHPNGSKVGFELGLGFTGYSGSDTTTGYADAHGDYKGGTAAANFNIDPAPFGDANLDGSLNCHDVDTCAGDESHFGQTGFLKFERDYDIDIVARALYFVRPDVALYAGGGVSWAKASLSAVNGPSSSGNADLDDGVTTGINDKSDTSLGFVLGGGATWWVDDRITIGLDYTYKRHEFEFDANSSGSTDLASGISLTSSSSDKITVEDDVHAIKARVGFKLN